MTRESCRSRPERSERDVLITGIGLVSPLGNSVDTTWGRLLNGERASRLLTDTELHTGLAESRIWKSEPGDREHQASRSSQICAALKDIPGLRIHGAPVDHEQVLNDLIDSRLFSEMFPDRSTTIMLAEPLVAMSLLSLCEAVEHAGLRLPLPDPDRLCVTFGSSKGGLRTTEQIFADRMAGRHRRPKSDRDARHFVQQPSHDEPAVSNAPSETFWTSAFPTNSATVAVARALGAQAGMSCPVAACATGLISVLQGMAMVRSGLCDICVAGSADAGLRPSVLSSFHRLRVTSRHSRPSEACRPFDVDRDGFVIGEGAGVLILESREHATRRGAVGLARIESGFWLADPSGMTQIDPTGTVVEQLLTRVCSETNRVPDVISLHGTGTISNDLAEARGIHATLGADSPHAFGIKGAIGHLLGAAGSVETAILIRALRDRCVPGTTNLMRKDPQCPVNVSSVPCHGPEIRSALKLSLGFGGHAAAGLFTAVD